MASVVIVSHEIPKFPGPGASTRAFCLARALSREFELTFLLPRPAPEFSSLLVSLNDLGQTREAVRQWTSIEWRLQQLRQLANRIPALDLLSRKPRMVRDIEVILPALRKELARLNWEHFDLIHFVHPHAACVLETVDIPVPKTLDWIDERTNVLERSLIWQEAAVERWKIRIEVKRIQAFQRRVGRLFDASFASSVSDADRLAEMLPGRRPTIVSNGVDTTYFNNENGIFGNPRLKSLLFSGHMGYEPNIDAISFFWREIWPLIAARVPGVRLTVVGASPAEDVQRLAHQDPEHVTVTGRVDDVRPHLAKALVCLAPLRSGSGTRLKILEAMAMGRPVVSTSIGCEGLDVRDGDNILIRDSAEDFATAVVRLLENEEECQRLGENGRRLVRDQYDWKKSASPMARVWHELIG